MIPVAHKKALRVWWLPYAITSRWPWQAEARTGNTFFVNTSVAGQFYDAKCLSYGAKHWLFARTVHRSASRLDRRFFCSQLIVSDDPPNIINWVRDAADPAIKKAWEAPVA